jgi:hypothetical protein
MLFLLKYWLSRCLSVRLTVWMSEFDRLLFCLSILCLEFVSGGDVTGKSERIKMTSLEKNRK